MQLAISQRTVECYLTSITQKLGVKSRIEVVARGYETGMLGTWSQDDEER